MLELDHAEAGTMEINFFVSIVFRKRVPIRCSDNTWLQDCHTRVVRSSEFGLAHKRIEWSSCFDRDSEVGKCCQIRRGIVDSRYFAMWTPSDVDP